MKIFIAGARSVKQLDDAVKQRLLSIYQKGYDVLVGDCYGVDSLAQKFYNDLDYDNVTVYASNGKTRNNIGKWNVHNVSVASNMRGFDFYRQKDIAMANDADYGFMVWDGKSRGTLCNITTLVEQNKKVLVYLTTARKMIVVKNSTDLKQILCR